MPVIKSAKKKMRQDLRRTKRNSKLQTVLKNLIKQTRRAPSAQALSQTTSKLDKAVKTHLIHKNKANRQKSRLAHLLSSK